MQFKGGEKVKVIVDESIEDVMIPLGHFEYDEMVGYIKEPTEFKYTAAGDAQIYEVLIGDQVYDIAEYMMEEYP